MAHWDQYEIWEQRGEKWEMTSSFRDFDVASAVARNKNARVRLIHATYEDSKKIGEDILAEVGTPREQP